MVSVRWILDVHDRDAAGALAESLGISTVIAGLIIQRTGSTSSESAKAFLRPSLANMISPWEMADMDIAADRIASAVKNRERVIVYGDYDTDGVTACAAMLHALRAVGADCDYYLPDRMEEGYGISDDFVTRAVSDKVAVVVTVDCGTSEHERIAKLKDAGIDVIVTDHHEPGGGELPQAFAIVNPKRTDATYPFRELTGVGVSFKLAWAVFEKVAGSPKVGPRLQEALLSLLPFVAIGSIADVAPLVGENRILVSFGLRGLSRARAGLTALLSISRRSSQEISVRDVAFGVSPRINAAGRMGNAELALKLLLEDDSVEGERLARELDRHNNDRQVLCREILDEAIAEARATHDLEQAASVVVAKEGWHEGVIGIVAGRLTEEFGLPAVVIAFSPETGKGKGSARSVDGINLYKAMSRSRNRFLTFGGHEQAAGFSIMQEELESFRQELDEECRQQTGGRKTVPQIAVSAEVQLKDVNESLVREISMLRPFGKDNPPPLLLVRGIKVAGTPRLMGKEGKHFSFNSSQGGVSYRAVVFNNTEWLHRIDEGAQYWDIVFSPDFNDYYSPPRLELRIEDMREVE